MDTYFDGFRIARLLLQRSLAGIYLVAFIAALNQFPALLGENGLLPVADFIKHSPFKASPNIFYLHYSDQFLMLIAAAGIVLSLSALFGISESGSWWLSTGIWFFLWVLYLSIVNVGQTFYSFGWETMLLEAGFFAAFLGPSRFQASVIPILILRWMLFRVELGAGLIKLRSDPCWRDLTCLFYHYETQPLPNPLSWYFHYLPKFLHAISVLFSHFVQVIVPFGLFGPQKIAAISGGLIIFHQFLLIISGNYSWLNWLTVVLGLSAFSDSIFGKLIRFNVATPIARPQFYNALLCGLAAFTVILSILPVSNLFSRRQMMNYSYNPLRLVNTYGAFGSMTKERYEIVIEGTDASGMLAQAEWKEYGFMAKPGDVRRLPPQIAPYHLRLDWLMWFLPFSVTIADNHIIVPGYELWFMRFIQKLLQGDKKTLKLLRINPFPGQPPRFIRARFYRYRYTDPGERKNTGNWWRRDFVDDYLSPVALPERTGD
ncbi:MAG: lipase maturation factor family protein [Candidatus Omnitrophota bacterium]